MRWKDVKGYGGVYKVSDSGLIMRSDGIRKEHSLKTLMNNNGYLTVNLSKQNKQKRMLVHRVVAEAFIENPNNKQEVNHIDGNKENNNVKNLEWVDRSENLKHAFRQGLRTYTEAQRIASVKNLKRATETIIKAVLMIDEKNNKSIAFKSIAEAERITGIKNCNICECCKGHRQTAGGYKWKYIIEQE